MSKSLSSTHSIIREFTRPQKIDGHGPYTHSVKTPLLGHPIYAQNEGEARGVAQDCTLADGSTPPIHFIPAKKKS